MERLNQSAPSASITKEKMVPQIAVVAGCLLGAQCTLQLVVPVSLLLLQVLQGLCQFCVIALRIFGIWGM